MKGEERDATDHFQDDQVRTLFSREYGPLLSSMLWVREDGRLSLSISSLGRPVHGGDRSSPWVEGDDTKILYIYITEEAPEERAAIAALFKAFTSDPLEYGRRLLSVFIPIEDVDYLIDADKLEEIMNDCRESAEPALIAQRLKPNVMIAYYTYEPFSIASELVRLRRYLYESGIAHLASGFFNGVPTDGDHAAVAKHLKRGCRDIPYAVRATIDKLKFDLNIR